MQIALPDLYQVVDVGIMLTALQWQPSLQPKAETDMSVLNISLGKKSNTPLLCFLHFTTQHLLFRKGERKPFFRLDGADFYSPSADSIPPESPLSSLSLPLCCLL